MPCPDGSDHCFTIGVAEEVTMVIQYVTAGLPDSPPSDSDVMASATSAFGGRPYVVVSFEWATDDHRAPAGHADVAFRIELSSDDAEMDPDEADVVYSANATGRQSHYFEVHPDDDMGDVDVDYSITPNPNDPNATPRTGTFTIEAKEREAGPFGPVDDLFRGFWGWIVLLLMIGAAIGMAIRHWLLRHAPAAPRPLAM